MFAALGDGSRLRLVSRLRDEGQASIARLASGFDVTRQAITKHLRVMESAGLVRSARRGRERLWRLERQRLAEASRYLQSIAKGWEDALGRLKRYVEDE